MEQSRQDYRENLRKLKGQIRYSEWIVKNYKKHQKDMTFPRSLRFLTVPKMGTAESTKRVERACQELQQIVLQEKIREVEEEVERTKKEYERCKEERRMYRAKKFIHREIKGLRREVEKKKTYAAPPRDPRLMKK